MEVKGAPQIGKENKYGYNGKELNEEFGLNWHHYGFRMYDAAIGRFTTTDLLSETYPFQSSYVYAANNPITNIDFLGLGPSLPKEDVDNEFIDPVTRAKSGLPPGIIGSNGNGGGGDPPVKNSATKPVILPEISVKATKINSNNKEKSKSNNTKSMLRMIWDSPAVRLLTSDAISIGWENNLYIAGGASSSAGLTFILHGPEAFTFRKFIDSGVGVGVEYSTGVFLNQHWVLGASDDVQSEYFGGLRTSASIDVGEGFIGGVNVSVNNPTSNSPLIISTGVSGGAGATSPFGIGGNVNQGITILIPK